MRRQEGKEIVEQDKYSIVAQVEKEEQEIDEEGGEKVKIEDEQNRNEVEYAYDEAPKEHGVARVGANLWENKVGSDIRLAKKKQPKIASVGAAMKSYEEIAAEREIESKKNQQQSTKQNPAFAQREFFKPVQPQISYSATPDLLFEPTFKQQSSSKFVNKQDFGDVDEVSIDIGKFMNK